MNLKAVKAATVIILTCIAGIFSVQAQDFYWEQEKTLVESGAGFSRTAAGGGVIATVWQEITGASETGGEYYLSAISSVNGEDWTVNKRFAGPYKYTGKQSYFFSLVVDDSGKIMLAVSNNDNSVSMYESDDRAESFREISRSERFPLKVSPRLSMRSDGGLILFITQESVQNEFGSLGIYYSVSDNGTSWTGYSQLAPESELKGNFLPSHTSWMDREFVVFQAFNIGATSTFQLYLKYSDNGGITWSAPLYLSGFEDFNELYDGDPYVFDNQRPYIHSTPSGIGLVWERGFAGGNPQIYYGKIGYDGTMTVIPEQVSSGNAECRSPRLTWYDGNDYIIWFDNRVGDYHNIMARRDGLYWSEDDLNYITDGSSIFGNLLVSGGDLLVLWENEFRGRKRLMMLGPDKTVSAPVLRAADFIAGRPAGQSRFTVRWNSPDDSSGIAGYSYSWSADPEEIPEERLQMLDRNREITVEIEEDGSWFFQVIAQDYAGNWSEPARIEMVRDTTPPGKVVFAEPELDDNETMLSNTSSIKWTPPEDVDVAGYSYNLQYIGLWNREVNTETLSFRIPAARVQTADTEYPFRNIDNGLWSLSVRAVDLVGNTGETETVLFRLNKYIPVTYITGINSEIDDLGAVTLEITGRGFSVGGLIQQVILDRDAAEPYDYTYGIDDDLYSVENDRYISGPVLENIDTGTYRIGLIHPSRGLYFTQGGIDVESSGTVKLGDFSSVPQPVLGIIPEKRFTIPFKYILFSLMLMLLVFLFVFTVRRTALLVTEAKTLKRQAVALIEGGPLTIEEKEERIAQMSKIRMGLRVKFSLLMTILVLLIVAMISIPIAFITSGNQREILASGLEDRAEVLLESLASGARTFLPAENIIELSTLPAQMSALGEDAVFVTLTSAGSTASETYDPEKYDYVWATNDELLPEEAGAAGYYLMNDEIAGLADALRDSINEEAAAKVDGIVEEIKRLNTQVEPLVARFIQTGNAEDEEAINQIQDELRELDKELNNRLFQIGNRPASYPVYNSQDLAADITNYTFYKPIVFRTQGDSSFFRGIVRLGVSTEGILANIKQTTDQLIKLISAIAAGAILLGIVVAFVLSSIIIRPINTLVRGVEIIRDTEDKEALSKHEIKVKTRDELAVLADTVNQMTHGLVKAAVANKDLTVGKEVQKMFIPLDKDSTGKKASTGKEDTETIGFFGYYEGAKGVSGDYFDFRKIDEVHYAAIKCDVAGKGVPASLIMVEVATIFLSFFRNRKSVKTKSGKPVPPNIVELTYSINDMLEERGFKGRFAAFTIIIINSETGELYICNAGDKLLHMYDSRQQKMIIKELPESPASGVFASDMVRMGTGFVQVKDKLNPGDSLLMFTDGLEEAQRKFRDENFNVVECNWKGLERGTEHDTHPVGNDNEEFGIPRIQALINALMAGEKYSLYKYHNPFEDEELIFDFTNCDRDIEDIVMASVSVERVFRLYPDPSAGPDDRVNIDKAIAEYLKEHFEGFDRYFGHIVPGKEDDEFITYSHLKEDEQYDDLTLLGIMKK